MITSWLGGSARKEGWRKGEGRRGLASDLSLSCPAFSPEVALENCGYCWVYFPSKGGVACSGRFMCTCGLFYSLVEVGGVVVSAFYEEIDYVPVKILSEAAEPWSVGLWPHPNRTHSGGGLWPRPSSTLPCSGM